MQKKRLTRQEYIDMTEIQRAAQAIKDADALLIGASNGLSIAEGYHIFANNEMFRRQFGDIQQKYGIRSVIEGCFFHYPCEADRREFLHRLIQYWVTDYRPSQVVLNTPIVGKSREANAFIDHYHSKRLVILELGIGSRNRLIKLPLMQLAAREPQAVYITLNLAQELYIPNELTHKSIGLAGDIAVTLQKLKEKLV